MHPILWLIITVSDIFVYFLIGSIIMSWLIAFNIINPNQPFVRMIGNMFYQVTEPVLRPIRNLLPELGGIDLSPMVVVVLVIFSQMLLVKFFS